MRREEKLVEATGDPAAAHGQIASPAQLAAEERAKRAEDELGRVKAQLLEVQFKLARSPAGQGVPPLALQRVPVPPPLPVEAQEAQQRAQEAKEAEILAGAQVPCT